ncbi:MAG: 16S rRNA (adenine(1518)-N(6)/adenine(1519)-N(6))-dimethyltransferase RsmA [Eubacteriales bacterium]|nr:16S rRNA (adenine(1518)-N(6)/adenine(1519)-N(6))-dimethyltransferase RsmA [Eubacteriales bacterium]
MNLYDINTIKKILSKYGFTFSKALGQNFLIDPDVCPNMAKELNVNGKTGVLEIGPGIGVLTKELCKVAKKVVAVELDKRLLPVLGETLGEFDNLEIVNGDVMELDLKALIDEKFADCDSVKVCANLPYYITSPIIMMLLESELPIDEIVVMVQKEAGERLCAEVGTRQAGAVSVAVNFYADGEILFDVPRTSFVPSPKVDSVVIKLTLDKAEKYRVENKKKFFSLVKCAFAQRRKTALNSISNTMGVQKEKLTNIFDELGLEVNIRPEKLTMQNLIDIADRL